MAAALDPLIAILEDHRLATEATSLRGVLEGAASVYLWGTSRPLVNSVLYSLARRLDPEFTWLHMRDRSRTDPVDRLLAEDLHRAEASSIPFQAKDLVPRPTMKAASLSWLVKFDESPDELNQLRAFLALPEVFQEAVSRTVPPGAPRVLAIPNSDRLAELFVGRVDRLGALARILKESSVSIMVGQSVRDGPIQDWFDYAFEVRGVDLGSWQQGSLVCERSPNNKGSAAGMKFPLRQLPWAADVLVAASKLASQ